MTPPIPPPDEHWHLPTRLIGRDVRVYARVGSTNDLAADLARDPANAGAVVLAAVQDRGRGTSGRTWLSPPGLGVTLSAVVFPPRPLQRPAVLTAWAAVAVVETVRNVAGLAPVIKWPNDILVAGRKVCGVLIEQRTGAGTVAGIGLNVNHTADDFAAAGLPVAGSLLMLAGRPFDYRLVARTLVERLDAEYERLDADDLAGLEDRWRSAVGLFGAAVRMELTDGQVVEGRLEAMAFDGVVVRDDGDALRGVAPESVRALAAR